MTIGGICYYPVRTGQPRGRPSRHRQRYRRLLALVSPRALTLLRPYLAHSRLLQINWEYGGGRGFAGIVASWFISIAVSGVMAALLYLIMKYSILRYKNSFQRSLVFGPIVFGLAYGIMCLALVWKGTPKLG